MTVFTDFDEAKAVASADEMVCGTLLPSGEPRYFVMPRNADDSAIEGRAFQIREGRELSSYEQWLLRQVRSGA